MAIKKNKEVTKDQAVFMTVNDGKFSFELWPNKYNYDTMNHLYMPEFILNVGGEPFVYFIHIFYVVGERMLELKALKLYLASYKDMRFDNFEEVYTKLREDLVKLAGPEYLKLQVTDRQYIMTEGEFLSSSTPKSNFAFDSYLNSRLVHNDSELPCEITAYADAIVNISQSVPVICDIYVLSNKDLKGQFIKTIMKLHDQKLITEEVPKFILNELKHLDEDLEVIVDFNIRGNIKKIRSVYQGDLSNLKGRDYYIEQIMSQFSSYTS